MPLRAHIQPHVLDFRFEAGTSRGILTHKKTWYVKVYDTDQPDMLGIGECAPLVGLSIDDRSDFETQLTDICQQFNQLDLEIFSWNIPIILNQLIDSTWPSIRFGFETALFDYLNGGQRIIFDNDFVHGLQRIPINGLIWMGQADFMLAQIEEKIKAGYDTLKIKVGALDFQQECAVLAHIRQHFSSRDISLRVDANGAFNAQNVFERIEVLAEFDIHSIEQPIQPQQHALLADLCQSSPIPIALDEELIGIHDYIRKKQLLKKIKPAYIILKPTLLGGCAATKEWIEIAQKQDIGWWITSALESNIGLNAIAQFTASLSTSLPQGLGTGLLYHNNIPSPLTISSGHLHYELSQPWDFSMLQPKMAYNPLR